MHAKAVFVRDLPGGPYEVDRIDLPASEVVGVLQADQRGRGIVGIAAGSDGLPDGLGREYPSLSPEGSGLYAGDRGQPGAFVHEHVRGCLEDDLIARLREALRGHLVAHRSGGYVESRVHPEQLRGFLLKPCDGRVLTEHVVTDLRVGHRLTHLRARPGYGIASQIDDSIGDHIADVLFLRLSRACCASLRPSSFVVPLISGVWNRV